MEDKDIPPKCRRSEWAKKTDNVQGLKAIQALSNEDLLAIVKDKNLTESLRVSMGKDTNPGWVMDRVADEMYARGMIDADDYDDMRRPDFLNELLA